MFSLFRTSFQIRGVASSKTSHSPICVIGGGCAGVNVASQLIRAHRVFSHEIRVFEPSKVHFYQPGFTLVGGGLMDAQKTLEHTSNMFHTGVNLTHLRVTEIDPERNLIKTEDGGKYTYDQLIICAGTIKDISQTKGLEAAYEDPEIPVSTIYTIKGALKWSGFRESFKGGKALFADSPEPLICGTPAQKPVHLAIDTWKRKRVPYQAELSLNAENCFESEFYEPSIKKQLTKKKVDIHFTEKLIEINGKTREAVFLNTKTQATRVTKFDVLHTVPYQKPPEFIARSGLSDTAGYLDVDKGTLQSRKYKNIWGLGDSSNVPTSKTCSAVYSQSPVLLKNLMEFWKEGKEPSKYYNGYTAIPVLVGKRKLILCEYLYYGVPAPSFFKNQFIPQTWFYFMKIYIFPWAYFKLAPKGLWYGRDHIVNPIV